MLVSEKAAFAGKESLKYRQGQESLNLTKIRCQLQEIMDMGYDSKEKDKNSCNRRNLK